MSDNPSCACPEYYELSRRRFMQMTAGSAAALAAASWLPRISLAQSHRSGGRDVMVTIFLRGAADCLTMVAPYNDANYQNARPTLRVAAPDDPVAAANQKGIAINNAVTPGGTAFCLAPALAPLAPIYNTDQKLLIVHATGSTNSTRSHFDGQRYMETGKPGDNALFSGWLGRHLMSVSPPMDSNGLLRAIGIADGLQRALVSGPLTLPIPNPASYTLSGTSSSVTTRKTALMDMYGLTVDPVKGAAQTAIDTINLLGSIGFGSYVPAGGAVYPSTGVGTSFGNALKSTAALIRAGIGLEAVAIDLGGWDNHTGQRPFQGTNTTNTMYGYMEALANGLAAFYKDLTSAPGAPNFIVTVMSEFGRRLAQAGTLGSGDEGTDHGHGTAMFVMGPAVAGGRVLTNWPGLGPGQLFQNLDLNVTIDYRHILAEIVANRLGNTNLSTVFPGFTPQFQGVLV
jgi:uncharacterized protein (DUF1501 family)